MPPEKFFSASDFGISYSKTGENFNKKLKLNIAISEPADEDLPTFSLGLEYLTPTKQPKEKEKKKTSKATVFAFRKSK